MTDLSKKSGAHKARLQLGGGLFFCLWAGLGWYGHLTNDQLGGDFGLDPGPGLLPSIVLSILTIGALILIGMGLTERARSAERVSVDWPAIARSLVAPMLLCLSLTTYLPLIRMFGFVPATMLFSALLMIALSRRKLLAAPRSELQTIVIGVLVCTALTYALFIYWIGVPLR